jgi:hypothetical protein
MAEITFDVDPANDLAFFVVNGIVSADEIIAVAREQASFKMAKHLVDMTEANFSSLDVSNLTAITEVFSEFDNVRSGGRTAVVISSDVDESMVKLFASLSALADSPIVYKITTSRNEALAWLSETITSR